MPSILQPWVMELGLRHQGVLVSACRGCDTAPKGDPSKWAQRLFRGAILEPHCGRFVKPVSYIIVEPDENKWWSIMRQFYTNADHYPHHYVMHFRHAAQIIGYYGPRETPTFAIRWVKLYGELCQIEHLEPEPKPILEARLNADEKKFAELQSHGELGSIPL